MNMTYHLLPSSLDELNSYANVQNLHHVKTIISCFQDAIFISKKYKLEVLVCIQNMKFTYKFHFWNITHWEMYILILTLLQGL
jgi:hypothetical protein